MYELSFNPKILNNYFDNKVREMCKSCKRFGASAQCPPHLESVEYYKKLLPSYKYGIIYYETFDCSNKENWKEIGRASSLFLSEHLLKVRTKLFSEGHTFINVFGAGSCKVCEKCQFPCRFPDKAVVPLEATGLNVVDFMKEFDVFIKFPIDNEFMRIGMVLYDE